MNKIKIFNSLTNKLEEFIPLKENEVSIYFCGPTVYDDAHIGNLRPPVFFDFLKRFLEYLNYKVILVSNLTDIDDKIINSAKSSGVTEREISEHFIARYQQLLQIANVNSIDYKPKVTDNINNIIDFIQKLIDKGFAYNVNGNVYFSVHKIKEYGQLSNIKIEELEIGSRIEENKEKKNPLDFTLWKATSEGIKWNSPFGLGRPGWHTECVVMIDNIFHRLIDIHGGGFDLKFPHHENEIAQSMAANSHKIASIWMHLGFINVGEEKMSKSLGNFVTGQEVINKYGTNLSRFMLLSTHYRAPVNYSEESIASYQNELNKILQGLRSAQIYIKKNLRQLNHYKVNNDKMILFLDALCNDLNIANALTITYDIIKEINLTIRSNQIEKVIELENQLYQIINIFGFIIEEVHLTDLDIKLFNDYEESRNNKDFLKSDQIRKILIEKKLM